VRSLVVQLCETNCNIQRVLPAFTDTWLRLIMGQEGWHETTGKFSAEYRRNVVTMLDAPGVTVTQIAADHPESRVLDCPASRALSPSAP